MGVLFGILSDSVFVLPFTLTSFLFLLFSYFSSFLASLTPDLRQEILLTADDTFIQSLPPNIIAEANVLRERVNAQHRQAQEAAAQPRNAAGGGGGGGAVRRGGGVPRLAQPDPASRRRQRNGKLVSFLSRIVCLVRLIIVKLSSLSFILNSAD